MKTILAIHEVDDVDHWLKSPKRQEFFGPLGITCRTFVDPEKPNSVGLLVEVPSMEVWAEAMSTPAAADAMKTDGVRPETIRTFIEG